MALTLAAQPQWKFHVAYEDATGARDTIFFIWDTSAVVYGIDTALGEGNAQINYNEFNVFTLTWGIYPEFDTTKTVAYPYNVTFSSEIKAINFELPITISWDSSLFHAGWLPPEPVGWVNRAKFMNDYFFWINNDPLGNYFDMTLDHQVRAPDTNITDPWFWNPQVHFPMNVLLMQDPAISIRNIENSHEINITLYPNPAYDHINLTYQLEKDYSDLHFEIYSVESGMVGDVNLQYRQNRVIIPVDNFPAGIYLIRLVGDGEILFSRKFIVRQ